MTRSLHPLARLDGWPRRVLALVLLLLALVTELHSARPSARAATTAVVVAARDLPAGAVVSDQDVRSADWGGSGAPSGLFSHVADVLGRRVAGPVGAGEPLTATRLLGAGLLAGLAGDQVAVTVAVGASGGASVARAGDRVDLIAAPVADGTAATVLAQAVRVLAVLPAGTDTGTGATQQLVVAVDRPAAVVIAAAAGRQILPAVVGAA